MNFGPDHNGRVLPIFEERLRDIGTFVNAHEEAIFETKPWIYQNDSDSTVWYNYVICKNFVIFFKILSFLKILEKLNIFINECKSHF